MINFSRKESVAQNGEDFEFLYSHFMRSLLRSLEKYLQFYFLVNTNERLFSFPKKPNLSDLWNWNLEELLDFYILTTVGNKFCEPIKTACVRFSLQKI